MGSKKKSKNLAGRISECFFDGLIVLVPPVITIFVVNWILNLTENGFGKLLEKYLNIKFPGMGIITILIVTLIVGFVTGNNFAKKVIRFFERLLDKIPVVKFIYGSVKQFSRAILESNSTFKHVVLVPYQKSYVMGFLMTNVPSPVREKLGVNYVNVYVPWSLNMTSGMNLFVKRSDIVFVDMKSEDALQFILTAGTISKKI